MLGKARIDAPGARHHIIVRGINRRKIFFDDSDREDFLDRLGGILSDSKTACFAWAFMTNHLHLLLRTGVVPIASVSAQPISEPDRENIAVLREIQCWCEGR
jgi:REP element-mobilizing transposase RayT